MRHACVYVCNYMYTYVGRELKRFAGNINPGIFGNSFGSFVAGGLHRRSARAWQCASRMRRIIDLAAAAPGHYRLYNSRLSRVWVSFSARARVRVGRDRKKARLFAEVCSFRAREWQTALVNKKKIKRTNKKQQRYNSGGRSRYSFSNCGTRRWLIWEKVMTNFQSFRIVAPITWYCLGRSRCDRLLLQERNFSNFIFSVFRYSNISKLLLFSMDNHMKVESSFCRPAIYWSSHFFLPIFRKKRVFTLL